MSSSSSFLRSNDEGRGFSFRSHKKLCAFLDISAPYNTCVAYTPGGKYAPHCARAINRIKQGEVPAKLAELSQARIPSTKARRLLEELSSRVVCGITGWHQPEAGKAYEKWCAELWNEYLRVNDLDPDVWVGPTPRLSANKWETELEEIQLELEASEDESSEAETDSDDDEAGFSDGLDETSGDSSNDCSSDSDNDSSSNSSDEESDNDSDSELSEPPVATKAKRSTSGFPAGGRAGHQTRYEVDSLHNTRNTSSQALPKRDSSVKNQRTSTRTLTVFRDVEVRQQTSAAPSKTLHALQTLDRNVPVSCAREQKQASKNQKRVTAPWSTHQAPHPQAIETDRKELKHTSRPKYSSRLVEDSVPTKSKGKKEKSQGGPRGKMEMVEETVSTTSFEEVFYTPEEFEEEEESDKREEEAEVEGEDDDERDASNIELVKKDPEEDEANDFADHLLALDESVFDEDESSLIVSITPSIDTPPVRRGFRRYPQERGGPLGQLKQLFNTATQTVARRRRHEGFIYAFSQPDRPGLLKIGFVKKNLNADPVEERLAKWRASCGHPIVEVFRVPIVCQATQRIESLVHATLREYRLIQDPPCGSCERRKKKKGGRSGGGRHKEWFEVDEQLARHVVDMWALFASQLPYDRFGRLVSCWSQLIGDEVDALADRSGVFAWLDDMPQMVETVRRWEFGSMIGVLTSVL